MPQAFTRGYRRYVLGLLFVVYTFNFLDRQLMSILLQPIKAEFGFSDGQMGLLTGLAFAFLYTTLGFPAARIADRRSRVAMIAIALALWSFFTVATGWAVGFWSLLVARVLVGVGEAGCSPPAYSILSDYYAKEERGRAISIYSLGVPVGVCLGMFFGGWIAQLYGWRMAFYVAGIPGIALAGLVWKTLHSLPRGYADGLKKQSAQLPLMQTIKRIMGRKSFLHVSLAAGLHSVAGYGSGIFFAAYLMRSYAVDVGSVGTMLSVVFILFGGLGTFLGGYLADRRAAATGRQEYYVWVPGIATIVVVPAVLLVVFAPSLEFVLCGVALSNLFGQMFLGPSAALTQRLASVRERALAVACLFFVINFLGLGFGPVLVGVFSDYLRAYFESGGMPTALATAEGLRYALLINALWMSWSAVHYFLAARHLKADLALVEAEMQQDGSEDVK